MFKRCGNPKGAPPGGAPPDASAAHHLLIAAARLPLSEHSYNKPYEYQPMPSEMGAPHVPPPAPCAPEEASAQQQASSSQPASKSSGEDTLFESGVMGLMALFGGGGAPSGAPSTSAPVAAQEHGMRPEEAELGGEYTGESAAASRADTPPIPPRAPSPQGLLGGIGAVVLNGKRLRSARCGQCRGCNSGDCGQCKNCLDKPKYGGPGCRKQACMARTCSQPRVVDDEEEAEGDTAAAMEMRRAMEHHLGQNRKRDATGMPIGYAPVAASAVGPYGQPPTSCSSSEVVTYTTDQSGAASPHNGSADGESMDSGQTAAIAAFAAMRAMPMAGPPPGAAGGGVIMCQRVPAQAPPMHPAWGMPMPHYAPPPVAAAPVYASVAAAPIAATPVQPPLLAQPPVAAAPVAASPVSAAPVAAAPVSAAPVSAAPVSAAAVVKPVLAQAPVAAAPVPAKPVSAPVPAAKVSTVQPAVVVQAARTSEEVAVAESLFNTINRTTSAEVS